MLRRCGTIAIGYSDAGIEALEEWTKQINFNLAVAATSSFNYSIKVGHSIAQLSSPSAVVEQIFLHIVNELIAVEIGIGFKQSRHRVAISVHAKHFPVLVLDRIVVPVVPAPQCEGDASGLKNLLVPSAIWDGFNEYSEISFKSLTYCSSCRPSSSSVWRNSISTHRASDKTLLKAMSRIKVSLTLIKAKGLQRILDYDVTVSPIIVTQNLVGNGIDGAPVYQLLLDPLLGEGGALALSQILIAVEALVV